MSAEQASIAVPRRDPPSAKARATRARLIELSSSLFAREGLAAVSLQRLGKTLGLTTGAVYFHFRNKAELLAAAVAACITRDLETPEGDRHRSISEGVPHMFEESAGRQELRALLLEGAVAARTDAEVQARLRQELLAKLGEWIEVYSRWQQDAGLDPEIDMQLVVKFVFATELGLGVYEALGIDLPHGPTAAEIMRRSLTSLETPS